MQIKIEKLIYGGDGLARLPPDNSPLEVPAPPKRIQGKALFVPFVLEGELVNASLTEQKPGFARGSLNKILQPSSERIEPHCPYFARCGGCHYQHTNYENQLQIKGAILRENLRRIAKLELDAELEIHPSPEWGYRNRSRFAVQLADVQCPGNFALCYRKFNSHELLAVEQCPISSPLINRALEVLWVMARAGEFVPSIHEIEVFANGDDTKLLIELSCGEEASRAVIETFAHACIGQLPAIEGVVAFKDANHRPQELASVGKKQMVYETSHGPYRVSAGSFFQVNRHLINELVRVVTDEPHGETALDLYAGVGLFSSVLKRDFNNVIAVEPSPSSYADLQYNSAANVKAVHATTEKYLEDQTKKLRTDLVVVDPPRAGLSTPVIKALLAMKPSKMTYVSCDPATLARDMRSLLQGGYRIERADLFDLFPQTFHIESVFHLST